jgi:hypothetical protein
MTTPPSTAGTADPGQLFSIALQFREALSEIPASGLPPELSFLPAEFPRACCGPAVLLLNALIGEELGLSGEYVADVRPADQRSDAWLELDGLIVDVTADQFPDARDAVVVTRDRSWHAQFEENTRHSASLSAYDCSTRASYEFVIRELRHIMQTRDQ